MNDSLYLEFDGPDDYFEKQVSSQCAKHAINHILQENKIVYKKPPFRVGAVNVSGKYINKTTKEVAPDNSNPLDPNIQLNLYTICDEYDLLQAITSGYNNVKNYIRGSDPEERCDKKHENLPFEGIVQILSDMNYSTFFQYEKSRSLEEFQLRIRDPSLLGIILNKGGGHYVAISKFLKSKPQWEVMANGVNIKNLAYIDSVTSSAIVTPDMYTIEEMFLVLNGVNIYASIFIYAKEDSYRSVAVQRLQQLYGTIGGKRIKKGKTKKVKRKHQRRTIHSRKK